MGSISELTIMVADSDPTSRKEMCTALEKLGLENLVCAENAVHGLDLACDLREKGVLVSMVFCNLEFNGMFVGDFLDAIGKKNPGVIPITYSKVISPESHIMAMFETGSLDHIEQNNRFEERTCVVVRRWLKAAQLQFEYSLRYGYVGG